MKTILSAFILMASLALMAGEEFPKSRVLPYPLDEAGSIGITTMPEANTLRIIKVLPGGPAEEAKLKKDDLITQVDDKSFQELKPEERVDLLRGKTGTKVVLTISRPDPKSEFSVTMKRVPLTQFLTKEPNQKVEPSGSPKPLPPSAPEAG